MSESTLNEPLNPGPGAKRGNKNAVTHGGTARVGKVSKKGNLAVLREAIRQYTQDRKKAPQTLQDLVDKHYFLQLPQDPMTNSNSTWQADFRVIDISDGQDSITE